MEAGLELRSVEILRDGQPLLAISKKVNAGDVLTIMGPSGVGKSTLLAFITGTLSSDFTATGQVLLNGRDVSELASQHRRIGILFQDDLLFPHLSVTENLAFGLKAGGTRVERQKKIEAALNEVGLEGFGPRDPSTLSGGQKARVALMRMLLSEPCALLLDEPFSRLDSSLRAQIRDLVFTRAKVRSLPVLMVTHDEEDAEAAMGDIVRISPI